MSLERRRKGGECYDEPKIRPNPSKDMRVKRRTLNNETMAFEFDEYSPDYLVKNLGSSPILASFSEEITNDNSVKILEKQSEVIYINGSDRATANTERNVVYVLGSGEVEVRQLWH